MADLNFK